MTSVDTMAPQAIIETITCPITHQVMNEPVLGSDGITYERDAIVRWLTDNNTSPLNPSQRMLVSDLSVNYAIRHLIEQYNSGVFGNIQSTLIQDITTSQDSQTSQDQKIYEQYTLNSILSGKYENKYMLSLTSLVTNSINADRIPHDIVLAVDQSGSMNELITAKDETGSSLENGFTREDIVTHAARTIANTLNSNDRLCVIGFDHEAFEIVRLTPMTDANKMIAMDSIKVMKPRGQTNIWKAITMALDILNHRDDKTRNSAIILLTDGSPNSSPAMGEVEALTNMRRRINFSAPIYTCGFDYSLKRDLLYGMAKNGNGITYHIPDGSMVAAIFCNLIATILTTVANNVQLHIIPKNNSYIMGTPVMGDYPYMISDNLETECVKYIVDLGTVQLEQSRDIIMNLMIPEGGQVDYYVTYKIGGKYFETEVSTIFENNNLQDNQYIRSNIIRYFAVEELLKAIKSKNTVSYSNDYESNSISGPKHIQNIIEFANSMQGRVEDKYTTALKESLGDQIGKALSDRPEHGLYFYKWGEFYLNQFISCLNRQVRPNHRDQGVAIFGNDKFNDIMEMASEAFNHLDAPVPSRLPPPTAATYRGYSSPHVPQRIATMDQYNSRAVSIPCFHGDCLIRMGDNSFKKVNILEKNDIVWTPNGPAKLVCLLQTNIKPWAGGSGMCDMVELSPPQGGDSLYITPYHPVFIDNSWKFPININKAILTQCDAVYSILLEEHHIVEINRIQCICLAHGITEGILAHEYYGTDKIIQDMKIMSGWDVGRIIVNQDCVMRNPDTNLVSGLSYNGS